MGSGWKWLAKGSEKSNFPWRFPLFVLDMCLLICAGFAVTASVVGRETERLIAE